MAVCLKCLSLACDNLCPTCILKNCWFVGMQPRIYQWLVGQASFYVINAQIKEDCKTFSLYSQRKKWIAAFLMFRLCDGKPTVFLRLALPWSDLAFSKICTNSALIMIHFVYNVTEMKWKFNAHTSTMTCMDWRFKKSVNNQFQILGDNTWARLS